MLPQRHGVVYTGAADTLLNVQACWSLTGAPIQHMLVFYPPQGTQIQGSFWRESADKFYDSLQEDKVRVVCFA